MTISELLRQKLSVIATTEALKRQIEEAEKEAERLELLISIPQILNTTAIQNSILGGLYIKGEMSDVHEWCSDPDYKKDTRKKLVRLAMDDLATQLYTWRGCKDYAQWKDQVCWLPWPRHGYITFFVCYAGGISRGEYMPGMEEYKEAAITTLSYIRDGLLTTKQFNAVKEDLIKEAKWEQAIIH